LENYILVNEIFTIVGFMFFIKYSTKYLKPTQTLLSFSIIFFIIYGLIYIIISYIFLKDGTSYQYIRTLPLWYSTFSFFLGIEFYKEFESGKIKLRFPYVIAVLAVALGGRLSNQVIFPLLFINKKWRKGLIFFFLAAISVYKGGSTSYAILLIFIVSVIIKNRKKTILFFLNKYVLVIIIGIGLYALYYIYNTFSDFYNVIGLTANYDALGVDADRNALWRLMFWAYLFNIEILNKPLFGIGFGTKLFKLGLDETFFISKVNISDRNLEYTIGTHNSFFYILTRMGIVGFIPFMTSFIILIKNFIKLNHNNNLLRSVFTSFIFISISALFNVILESPLYASIYWILAGMLYQGIKMTKESIKQSNE